MQSQESEALQARYRLACELAKAGAELAFEYYQQREALTVDHKGETCRMWSAWPISGWRPLSNSAFRARFRRMVFSAKRAALACRRASAVGGRPHRWHQLFPQRPAHLVPVAGDRRDGEPVIGVVYDPNHRELFHALRGHGAWLNDAPIRPHPATTVKEGVMGVGTSHRVTPADFLPFLQALLSDGGMFIRNGSGALMSAWAAAGRLIGYYEPHMNPWDAAGAGADARSGRASNDFLAQEGIQRGNPLLLASQTLYPQLKKMIPQPLH